MRKQGVKRSLRWRLQRLEAEWSRAQEPALRIGPLRELPPDYTGERHIAIVSMGDIKDGRQSCIFEERPGPAPAGPPDRIPRLCLTEDEIRMAGDPIEEDDNA